MIETQKYNKREPTREDSTPPQIKCLFKNASPRAEHPLQVRIFQFAKKNIFQFIHYVSASPPALIHHDDFHPNDSSPNKQESDTRCFSSLKIQPSYQW